MNTIEIPDRNIIQEYPSNWGEMTDQHFECVMQNWLKVVDGKLNQWEFLLIILYNFLGIKRAPLDAYKDKRLSKEQLEDKFANVWQLVETITWLLREDETDDGPVTVLDYYEIHNRFPEIENRNGDVLIGPADGMLDFTFGEYRRAWDYFENFGKWRKETDLDKFIATLYRPERENYQELKLKTEFDGLRKEPFNPYLTEHYAELLTDIPFWKKQAIWLWFFNCDRFIKEEELELGGKPISFAPLFTRKTQNNDDDDESLDENDLGLTGLLYMVSESKLFGPPNQVDKTSYIGVLTALLYWKQQADRIKTP